MGFKDLLSLKQKENRIFSILVIWMLCGHILDFFVEFVAIFIFIPLVSYSGLLFVISTFFKNDITKMNFKEHLKIFAISMILGFIPLPFYLYDFINLSYDSLLIFFIVLEFYIIITGIVFIIIYFIKKAYCFFYDI